MINQQTGQFDIARHFDLIQGLQKSGRTQEAISALENASTLFRKSTYSNSSKTYLFQLFMRQPMKYRSIVSALKEGYKS
jgi:hypothetical protein